MRKTLGGVMLMAAIGAGAVPASAQKSADTLRITWRDAVPDVTPYYNQLRTGIVIGHQVWDSLVYRDPETFQLKPLLAESYKWVDETTLEFTLRQNVTFHNGDKLTADDVVYTINSILTDKQVSTPEQLRLSRSRDQGGRHACARGAEARVPRGARLHGDDALHHAEGVSREGGAAGILAASDRRGSLQDHQGERRHRSRSGAL